MIQDGKSLADSVASASINHYNDLPKHGKPQLRSNGVPEWTILATICLVIDGVDPFVKVISLGTGVKCLPANRLPPCGDTLHDSHAEVLARRGFVRWLIQQAKDASGDDDGLVQLDARHFRLRSDVQVWLYVSTLPCGDASTLHTAAHQPADMAALKNCAEGQKPTHSIGTAIRGRNGYEAFGAIRTKPGRADSVPSISFSCSDKIASWSVLGLQGALLGKCFDPVYLDGIVVGGVEDPPETWPVEGDWRDNVRKEIERAVYGRLECISGRLDPPYTLHRPVIHLTLTPFPYARDQVTAVEGRPPVPSVSCLLHLPFLSSSEVLFNGCKAATWKAPGFEALPERNRSAVCKLEMLRAFVDLEGLPLQEFGERHVDQAHGGPSRPVSADSTEPYYDIKHKATAYQLAKAILRGNPSNESDADAAFGASGPFQVTVESNWRLGTPAPPFRGWIVSGREFESFNKEGRVLQMKE